MTDAVLDCPQYIEVFVVDKYARITCERFGNLSVQSTVNFNSRSTSPPQAEGT